MPNYYAHLTFGAQCLDRLPRELCARLERERSAFDLGCLGPDPLFFYRVGRPNAVRREGMVMHARSALPAFERLRGALEEGLPMAAGYAAGFLCHLALDHACHRWVDQEAAAGAVTHLAMEAEFDRLLMERAGLVSLGRSYLPEPPETAVFAAAARAYQHASPEQVEEGYRSMCRDTALFARLSGHVPPAHVQGHRGQQLLPLGGDHPRRSIALLHQTADEGFVPLRLLPPKLVVEVGGIELEGADAAQVVEAVQQADRVGPAGQGAQHPAARGQHVPAVDEGVEGIRTHPQPSS